MCDECGSNRVLELTAKVSDRCYLGWGGKERMGEPLDIRNICGSDYVNMEICLDCGKGPFP